MTSRLEYRYFQSGSHIWCRATSRVVPTSGVVLFRHPEGDRADCPQRLPFYLSLHSRCFDVAPPVRCASGFHVWSIVTYRVALTYGVALVPEWFSHLEFATLRSQSGSHIWFGATSRVTSRLEYRYFQSGSHIWCSATSRVVPTSGVVLFRQWSPLL